MNRALTTLCLAIFAAAPMQATAQAPQPAHERALRQSDVVFFIDDASQYEAYGCTTVGWGGNEDPAHITAAHAAGVRHLALSLPFRTGFAGVIDCSDNFLDAACRDFSLEPFIVPWLAELKHKGQPMWWGCTNSPLLREWLERELARMMAAGPDGLHIDDYTGTAGAAEWLGGGFCTHCMVAFRAYVKATVAKERLAELGITDFDTFDYRQFLLARGVTPSSYKGQRASLPLAQEFIDFQMKSVTDYVRQLHEKASALRGQRVTLSVNSSLSSPSAIMIAPYADYISGEVDHQASKGGWPTHPVFIYKMADALHVPIASMGSGGDHAFIAAHNAAGLLRTWIVTAYSHGQNFMTPNRLWCHTKEKGTHWYSGPPEQYAWLYRFIRANATLFDGYEAYAPVAVVYDNASRRAGRSDIEPVCAALEGANVPFTVVAAGDDWLDYRLTAETIASYATLIVPEPPERMSAEQRAVLEASGRMAVFDDALLASLKRIQVEGEARVAAVLRVKAGEANAPAVLHVHSRAYDPEKDQVVPQANVVLRIPRAFLGARAITEATVYTPNAPWQRIAIETNDDEVILRLAEVNLWHVIAL